MSRSSTFKLPPEVLALLTQRSDLQGCMQLTAHLAILFAAAIGLQFSQDSIAVLLVLPVYAALFIFLFAPLHETIHFTVFETRWLNNLVAAPIGFLLFLPFQNFRAFHYAHHRYTQRPELDPELIDGMPLDGWYYWLHLSGLPTWWQSLSSIWRHATGKIDEPYLEQRHHRTIVAEARIHLAGYGLLLVISVLASSTALWWYWILPALLGQPMLRLFLLAEHRGCDFSDNMLENSRTTYTSPWLNFLAWNMPYHAEHHFLAAVPFYALPALHAYTAEQVKFKGRGYLQVNREIANQQ